MRALWFRCRAGPPSGTRGWRSHGPTPAGPARSASLHGATRLDTSACPSCNGLGPVQPKDAPTSCAVQHGPLRPGVQAAEHAVGKRVWSVVISQHIPSRTRRGEKLPRYGKGQAQVGFRVSHSTATWVGWMSKCRWSSFRGFASRATRFRLPQEDGRERAVPMPHLRLLLDSDITTVKICAAAPSQPKATRTSDWSSVAQTCAT